MLPPIRFPDKRAIVDALLPQFHNFISVVREFAIKCRVSASCCCNGGGHTHIQGRTASGDSSGGETISQPGWCFCESLGFRGDSWVREFQSSEDGVTARMVASSGFGSAAGFRMFQRTAASTLPTTHPESVAESFFVGNVVVRRQDTSRARVQVEPLVWDLRVAQVFDSCHLLPGPFGEECVLQTAESSPISKP